MLDRLIPPRTRTPRRSSRRPYKTKGIALELGKQCTAVEESGGALTVHFGEGESVEADLMLVAVGRAPLVSGIGLEAAGVVVRHAQGDRRRRRTAAPRCRTSTRSATAPATGSSRTRPSARARSRPRTPAATRRLIGEPAVPRPIYTDPEIAGVGLTEAQAREAYGDDVAVGRFPWIANARAVMQDETVGFVKSIHETRYGELLGLVIVGPHATDLIEAGVVALDAEATVETVADGMAPHPTLSEAIKEAGLVALGRAIHLPNRKQRTPAP